MMALEAYARFHDLQQPLGYAPRHMAFGNDCTMG